MRPAAGWEDLILAEVVCSWSERLAPGDVATARAAVQTALDAFSSGASVPEAYALARSTVNGRLRHPSYRPVPPCRPGRPPLPLTVVR
jgi:hypothetical protein